MISARQEALDRVTNVGSRDTPPCSDLRGEEYKEALSGPVITYPAIEELTPRNYVSANAMYVTICKSRYRSLYLNPQAIAWILERSERVRIKVDHINRRLIIEPDPNGLWKASPQRKGGCRRPYAGELGGSGLQKQLMQRGFPPGRYLARVEGNALVIDAPKQALDKRRK